MRNITLLLLLIILVSSAQSGEYPFLFKDVTKDVGLIPDVEGIRGHGVAWGDIDNDGWPDLFVTTFHNSGSKPAMLFRNQKGKFKLDEQEKVRTSGIGSGTLFVDLTNTGQLDLYVSHCAHGKGGVLEKPSLLFSNNGKGLLTDVSEGSGACPPNYAGRGLAALDFDGDGLLDLVLCEQYYSTKVKTGLVLLRNLGNRKFENVTEKAGLPTGFAGLAVTAADLNNDGWPDLFLSSGSGDHRLYLNDKKGRFIEAPRTRDIFKWKITGAEDTPAGLSIGDINNDGLPDIVIGNHFKTPWVTAAPVRLYLNRGIKEGVPTFEDVTEKSGLTALEMKAPHVEIADFNNDGKPDLYVSIVKFKDGIPQFKENGWSCNDFPTAEDKATKNSGTLFKKILAEKKIIYMAAAPSCDYNRDGRLDLFLANWWIESPSLLLENQTKGGNWLEVQIEGKDGVNRQGIGSKITLYEKGHLGEEKFRIGTREIITTQGYCSGVENLAHFGLGDTGEVDLEITLPHGKGKITQKGVKVNQLLKVKQ